MTLNENSLVSLPKSICFLSNLTELHLQKNKLQALPENFGGLISLKKLVNIFFYLTDFRKVFLLL